MTPIEERVIYVLNKTLKTQEIDSESELGKPYRWDSLRHMDCIIAIEKEFGIKVGIDKLVQLTSVNKISSFVSEKLKLSERAG
jgi:acyl carrier protein